MSESGLPGRPLAVVGPTGSGKSAAALMIARLVGPVELVSADSMQVYRRMDIGTAKATESDRSEVPHHLLDLVEPWEEYSVAEFQTAARAVSTDLRRRGAAEILVGGTGLYLQAVIDGLELPGRYPAVVEELERTEDTAALHARLAHVDPRAAARMTPSNRRRIVRALEVTLGSGRPFSSFGPGLSSYPDSDYVIVGLRWDRHSLAERLTRRLDDQMAEGFPSEAAALLADPRGMSRTAAQALGYAELFAHLRGEISRKDAVEAIALRTRRFAVRQERWFRRDPRIRWIDASASASLVAERVLAEWWAASGAGETAVSGARGNGSV